MDFIESMNAKWRMELFKICVVLAAIGSVAEVAIYWYDSTHRTLFLPLALYRARFIYIPSSLNIIVIVVTYLCLKSEKMTNTQKNVSACLLIYFLCANTQVIHYVYGPLLMLPCIAIFVTVLFSDRRLTVSILLLSYVSLSMAGYQASIELRKGDVQLSTDILLAVVVMFTVFVAANLIIKYIREQMDYILSASERQKQLIEECNIDPLMGIGNRRLLEKRLENVVTGEYPDKIPFLMMTDIDDFKKVNDTYGHVNGDEVLINLAAVIRTRIKDQSIEAFRYGGEEIILLAFNLTEEEVYRILDGIRMAFIGEKYSFDSPDRISFSAGIAGFEPGIEAEKWIGLADEKMYRAKREGKNRIIR